MKDSQFISTTSHPKNNNGAVMSGGGVRREEGGNVGGGGGGGFPPPHWPPHPLHHQLGSHHSQHLPRMMGSYYGGRGVTPTAAHSGGFGGGWVRGAPGQGGGGAGGLKPPERWSGTTSGAQQPAQAEGGMDLSQTRSNGSQPNGLAKEGVSVIAANPLRGSSDKAHEMGDGSEEEDEDCMVIEEGEEAPREGPQAHSHSHSHQTPPARHRLHGDPSIAQEAPPLETPPNLHRHHSGSSSGSGHQLPASVAQPLRSEGVRQGDAGGHRLPMSVQGLTRPSSPSLHAHQAMQFSKQILAQKQLLESQLISQHKHSEAAAYQQLLSSQKLIPPNPEGAHHMLGQGKLQGSASGLSQQVMMQQRGEASAVQVLQAAHHKITPDQPSPAHLHKPSHAPSAAVPLTAKVSAVCKVEEGRVGGGLPLASGAQSAPATAASSSGGTARNEPRVSASLPPTLGLNLPPSLQVIAHPAGTAVPSSTISSLELSSRSVAERRADMPPESPMLAFSEAAQSPPAQASEPLGAKLPQTQPSPQPALPVPVPVPIQVPVIPPRSSKVVEVEGGKDGTPASESNEEDKQIGDEDKDKVESMLENMFQQETPDKQSDSSSKAQVSRLSPALTEDKVVEILQDKSDEPLVTVKTEIKTEVEEEQVKEGSVAVGGGSAFMEVESELEKMFAGIVEPGGESDKPETPESARSWNKGSSSSVKRAKGRRPQAKRQDSGAPGLSQTARRKNRPMTASDKFKKKLNPRTEKIKEGSNDSSSISTGQMYKWRGPYIRVRRGLDGRPDSVTLVNSSSTDEERQDHRTLDKSTKRKAPRIVEGRTKGPGLYSSTLSSKYNSMVMDITWTCVFCNRRSHCENGLGGEPAGDLFGPYVVEVKGEGCSGTAGAVLDADVAWEQRKRGGGKQLSLRAGGKANHSFTPPHKKSRKSSVSEGSGGGSVEVGAGATLVSNSGGSVSMDVWVHEACAVWAPGVILVGPHLIGLDEAVSLSLHSKCSVCGENGACISCLQHGCNRVCHYGCARATQWSLDEQTFHARCLDHKKPITLSLALQQHNSAF